MNSVDGLANVASNRPPEAKVRMGVFVESFQFDYSRAGAQIVKFPITGSRRAESGDVAPKAAKITTISAGVGQAYIQDRNKP